MRDPDRLFKALQIVSGIACGMALGQKGEGTSLVSAAEAGTWHVGQRFTLAGHVVEIVSMEPHSSALVEVAFRMLGPGGQA